MKPLPFNKERAPDFETVARIGPEKFATIQAAIAKPQNKFFQLEQLSAFLREHLSRRDAVRVSSLALSLRRLCDRLDKEPAEILDAVTEGMKAYEWQPDLLDKWTVVRPHFAALLASANIERVTKSSDLYYKHGHHIHDMKIITEIRPILTEHRDAIDASIIYNTFFLQYSDEEENERTIQLSITLSELSRLKAELERALKKTELLKTAVETDFKAPVIVYDKEW